MLQKKCEKIDDKLMKRTLIPYSGKGTVYLKEATAGFKTPNPSDYSVNSDQD